MFFFSFVCRRNFASRKKKIMPSDLPVLPHSLPYGVYNKIRDRDWFSLRVIHVTDGRSRGGCPMTGVRFELFVIRYPRDFYVDYARFYGFFFLQYFARFSTLQMFSLKRTSKKSKLDLVLYNSYMQ